MYFYTSNSFSGSMLSILVKRDILGYIVANI